MTEILAIPSPAEARAEPSTSPLPASRLLLYAGPSAGHGFMFFLTGVYLMSFATDVLLVAPATMALLFGLSRLWDAVSDPIAGYLTDRTRSRFGRRRPWMMLGVVPMVIGFAMLWAPPGSLAGPGLSIWLGAALILFYTASTAVDVPHAALGAELSDDYHERTRLFGYKRALFGVGSMGVVGVLYLFNSYEPRRVGAFVAGAAAIAVVALVALMVARIRERSDYQGRGARHPWSAARDVWQNRPARLLLAVFLVQQLGLSCLVVSLPYYSKYVLGTPDAMPTFMLAIMASGLVSVPFWVAIAPRFDKRRVVLFGMVIVAIAIAGFSVAPVGGVGFVVVLAVVGGLASGALDVLMPSIQADVIDVDEHRTGERKEGAYFAAWAFAAKTAGGIAAMTVGFVLAAFGFEPNVEQSAATVTGIRVVAGIGPALAYAAGLILFLRFDLSQAEHARLRAELDIRRRAG